MLLRIASILNVGTTACANAGHGAFLLDSAVDIVTNADLRDGSLADLIDERHPRVELPLACNMLFDDALTEKPPNPIGSPIVKSVLHVLSTALNTAIIRTAGVRSGVDYVTATWRRPFATDMTSSELSAVPRPSPNVDNAPIGMNHPDDAIDADNRVLRGRPDHARSPSRRASRPRGAGLLGAVLEAAVRCVGPPPDSAAAQQRLQDVVSPNEANGP